MPEPFDFDGPLPPHCERLPGGTIRIHPNTSKPDQPTMKTPNNGVAHQRKPPERVFPDSGKEELGPPPDWLLPINAAKVSRIKVPEIIKGVLYQGGKITIQ